MKPINRQILALTIPSIIANITTPLLGLVDTAITGHMGSAVFLAAIAVGGTIFNMLYWCFSFLRAGTSGLTAQAYGALSADSPAAHDSSSPSLTLLRGLLVSAIIGVAMIALSGPLTTLTLRLLDVDATTAALSRDYVLIAIWGAPAVLANYTLAGWFIGMQDSRAPMWISIFINVSNILLSLFMVYVLHYGIKGLAVGTMTAQWTGAIIGIWLTRRHRPQWREVRRVMRWGGLKRFFSVNIDIFLRTLCLVAVTVWFTREGATQGNVTLAVNALIMQLFLLLSYVMDGFAFAGEALVGRYEGASDKPMRNLTVRSLLGWGVIVASIFTLLYALGGDMLLKALSSEPSVLSAAADYRWWAVTLPFAGFGAFVWDGVFIGLTRTRAMLLSMLGAMLVFFALDAVLTPLLGNHGLWLAFIAYLIVRGIILAIIGRDYYAKVGSTS